MKIDFTTQKWKTGKQEWDIACVMTSKGYLVADCNISIRPQDECNQMAAFIKHSPEMYKTLLELSEWNDKAKKLIDKINND